VTQHFVQRHFTTVTYKNTHRNFKKKADVERKGYIITLNRLRFEKKDPYN